MNNIRYITSVQISEIAGGRKNLSYTYDEMDEFGRVVRSNLRGRRIVTDDDIVAHMNAVTSYAQAIIDQIE